MQVFYELLFILCNYFKSYYLFYVTILRVTIYFM